MQITHTEKSRPMGYSSPVKTCSYECAYDCTTAVHNTAENSSDNLPAYHQIRITAQMLSRGRTEY